MLLCKKISCDIQKFTHKKREDRPKLYPKQKGQLTKMEEKLYKLNTKYKKKIGKRHHGDGHQQQREPQPTFKASEAVGFLVVENKCLFFLNFGL